MKCFTPHTLEELSAALRQSTAESRIIAGGTDAVIKLRKGSISPDLLIYPGGIPELSALSETADTLRIGAMVTMAEAAERLSARPAFRAIAGAAANVGSPQIRNKATLVGNLCNASPAGDLLPVVRLYDAKIEILSGNGALETLPAEAFVLGPEKTALQPGQAVTAVLLPKRAEADTVSAFRKIGSRQYVSIARESMGARLTFDAEGRIAEARVTLGAVAGTPIRVPEGEALLLGKPLTPELSDALAPIVAQTIRENCRPAHRLYKTEAARGLTADLIAALLEQKAT